MNHYDPNNIFARIVRGEIPNNTIYEDEAVLAFHDIQPAAPVHTLVIPKGPYLSFDDFISKAGPEMVALFFQKVQAIATQLGLATSGYRLITNHGADASQSVPHFHVHILGGKPLGALLEGDDSAR